MNRVRYREASSEQPKRARRSEALSRRAFWPLIGLVAAIYVPVLGVVNAINEKSGPDLTHLTPAVGRSGQYLILAWPDLRRGRQELRTNSVASGALVHVLGYMMDGGRPVREGERVPDFVLLPDAGTPIHPAHRFGDQMIDVRLEPGSPVRFSERSLVWAVGTLRMLPGDPLSHTPLYILDHARTYSAPKADIQKHFK